MSFERSWLTILIHYLVICFYWLRLHCYFLCVEYNKRHIKYKFLIMRHSMIFDIYIWSFMHRIWYQSKRLQSNFTLYTLKCIALCNSEWVDWMWWQDICYCCVISMNMHICLFCFVCYSMFLLYFLKLYVNGPIYRLS